MIKNTNAPYLAAYTVAAIPSSERSSRRPIWAIYRTRDNEIVESGFSTKSAAEVYLHREYDLSGGV